MRSLLLSLVLGLGTLGLSLGTPAPARAADHATVAVTNGVAAVNGTTQVAWGRWGWGYPGYGGFYRGYYPYGGYGYGYYPRYGYYGGFYPRYYGGFYPRYYGGWNGGWGGFYGRRFIW